MVLTINIPHTEATIKIAYIDGQTKITPVGFNYSDPFQAKALATVVDMVKVGSILVPTTEKTALVSIPGGDAQAMQATQPPAVAPTTQEAVTTQQLVQMVKDLQSQVSELQTALGQQAQPAPPQGGAPMEDPAAAAAAVAPAPAPPAPEQGLAGG